MRRLVRGRFYNNFIAPVDGDSWLIKGISHHFQYETSQKKRDEKTRQRLKEKEHKFGGPLRRETWIHPSGGRRIHRTTPLDLGTGKSGDTSDEEELDAMSTADVGH